SPFLYQRADPAKLLPGVNELGEPGDLARNSEGVALIGDPRSDSHMLVSQLHVALLKAHNRFVDRLRAGGTREPDLFDAAARETRWHYQWILANEYLPSLAGDEIVSDVTASGPTLYVPDTIPYLPYEFAEGAFRCGYGQIRDSYAINASSGGPLGFDDLNAFGPVPATHAVDWQLMFDGAWAARKGGGRPCRAQRARKIEGKLCGS